MKAKKIEIFVNPDGELTVFKNGEPKFSDNAHEGLYQDVITRLEELILND